MMDERYEKGLDAYASQFHLSPDETLAAFAKLVGERFGEDSIYATGDAWRDDALSLRDRSLVVMAALIAQGGMDEELRSHTRWALEHGCTIEELEEMSSMVAIYAGFAKGANGLRVIKEKAEEIEAG